MEIPRHWRLKQQRYQLMGEICPHCDAKIFPPRDVCPKCRNDGKNEQPELVTRGNVFQPRQTELARTKVDA